ncbi:uncharacterized protein LOC122015558 isoform X2 [Zingiber officinale]|uniref:uncharacterized protein LOC122012878 isoform X2 n=1 Tax=Zingiber officinale TaxID=94328 RepID=UPI001C4CEBED|nr:uncharacterized protein LOC122012878 isoform X2 [Zingiber officinale]XP_042428457.1 uncharacterized protein LOC122015558 isoform X2 [Zingiber officinale]
MSGRGREAMGRTPKAIVEDDYEFVMVCIGEEVRPSDLRLHLMKEISGMPTTLKKEPLPVSPDSTGEPSSSGTTKRDKSHSS